MMLTPFDDDDDERWRAAQGSEQVSIAIASCVWVAVDRVRVHVFGCSRGQVSKPHDDTEASVAWRFDPAPYRCCALPTVTRSGPMTTRPRWL